MQSLRRLLKYREQRKKRLTPAERMKVALYRHDPVLFVQKELGWEPSDDQAKLLMDIANLDHENFILCAGRGGGKTMVVSWIVAWSVAVLGEYFDRYDVNVLGGSLEQSQQLYDYFKGYIYKTPLLEKKLRDEPTQRKTLFKKSKVKALTASSKAVRGPHIDCLVLDEVCEADDDIIQAALPMITGSKHGRVIMLSTPHKFWGIFQDYWDNAVDYEYRSYGPWSLVGLSWINQRWVERARRSYPPDKFKVEIEGRFPKFGALVFPEEWIDACTADKPFRINPNYDLDTGVDWGDTIAKTVMLPVQYYDNKIKIPGPEHIWEDIPAPIIIKEISQFMKRSRGKTAYTDRAQRGNNDFLENTNTEVVRIWFARDKSKMIVNLQTLLFNTELEISPDCVNLLKSLKEYRLKQISKKKPKGQDEADACMVSTFQFADISALRESSLADKFQTL
jgi:hypothetical protein